MNRTSLFRKLLSLVFAAAVVFTVSVREVHYLFAQHEVHEHCENHLHSDNHHEDCSVCKFDISGFTDEVVFSSTTVVSFFIIKSDCFYQTPITDSRTISIALRGPPALA
jgi:hypothetical protein